VKSIKNLVEIVTWRFRRSSEEGRGSPQKFVFEHKIKVNINPIAYHYHLISYDHNLSSLFALMHHESAVIF